MNKKPLFAIAGIGLLALLVTVGLVVAGHRGQDGSGGGAGELSKEALEVESAYKELQARWRQHEAEFRDKKNFPELAQLDKGFKELLLKAQGLKGRSDKEKAALPHLAGSIEASTKVPGVYMMLAINPGLVGPKNWEEKNAHGAKANKEWAEWVEMTADLRQ